MLRAILVFMAAAARLDWMERMLRQHVGISLVQRLTVFMN